ncbi:hypothetical protein GCM10012290_25520 [Halolactibacillus alkaliphilus]|uniref:Polymerase/histidinol phosphatase N-terminal domain-containing protein n=1 Tax=Halolactibacillus alkaliphilus TaxID=442899 RepID=A0A511X504_9BACI|nr:PHP domain-containing protein [Halolactibacillus alkaliphilus]GEN58011.1 hypothetical protein HAL01_24750 [Halolactibacillus alkaliphilus]GGN76128.1 hypothetical protein GCM10012290_25520 [Halolactibacillus alkaliphilus]SFP10986.1 PHP domain-containing protein [Halolactibacillus alkaliphilus]
MNYKGARWYKTDLHLHTPASKCFMDKEVTAQDWVDRCIEQGLDVVAVTDHNTGGWIDQIKEAAKDTSLIVFPGVEVTCGEAKVHMLVLFDVDKSTQDIEDFLNNINISRENFATDEAFTDKNTQQLALAASQKNALVIPAHIDEFNGISNMGFTNRENLLKDENIDAVQVVHQLFLDGNINNEEIESTLKEYYQKDIDKSIYRDWKVSVSQALDEKKAILTFSDNPHGPGNPKHGLWGIGMRFTWIKLNETVNLDSLKQALILPEYRIRNDFQSDSIPYNLPDLWIKNIKVNNTILNRNRIELDFNPQMNSIIGGRGSGKSSILRLIRGVFKKIQDLELADSIGGATLKKEQEDFFKVNSSATGILLEDTTIEITVVKYGFEYLIKATGFQRHEVRELKVFKKEDSEFIEQDIIDLKDFFKFDIYSQKQIFEIARYPNALRNRIDVAIEGMSEINNDINKKKNHFLEQSAKIRSLRYQISKKSKIISEIKDKKEQISSFRESGFEDLVQKFKAFNNENELIKEVHIDIENKKDLISGIRDGFEIKNLNIESYRDNYQDEISTLVNPILKDFEVVQSLLQDAESKLDEMYLSLKRDMQITKWFSDRKLNRDEFMRIKQELAEKGIDDLSKLEKATVELSKLERDLKDIEKIESDIVSENEYLHAIYEEFIELRNSITDTRKQFINEVLSDENIKIEVRQYRDRNHYLKRFREIIQKETSFKDDLKIVADKCLQGGNVIDLQQELINEIRSVRNNGISTFSSRFESVLKELNEEQIDELLLHLPEDEITVKYRANSSSGFQLLSNASAGQKTSAILTFLLSYGDVPLLLDQPEDDLDNHLIYELIVDRLKIVKNKRQIIVVSHNANIPVNGDTEWLIAMNSKSRDIDVLYSGTIEVEEVRKEICDVMEGGENAFKLRAKRYNI